MYICIYEYIYIYICVCVYVYIYMYKSIRVHHLPLSVLDFGITFTDDAIWPN